MSDDTPTQRIPSGGEIQEDLQEEKAKSKGLLIGLIAAGVLLLVAIIVLVFFLGRSGAQNDGNVLPTPDTQDSSQPSDTPSAEATPSGAPSASAEPTQDPAPSQQPQNPPPATGAAFTTFSPTKQVECDKGGPNFTPDPPSIRISWKTVRADSAWIVQGTSDAADSQFMQIPLNGNETNFQYTLQFPCFQDDATYTITLVGSDGKHVSKSWKVTNVGETD